MVTFEFHVRKEARIKYQIDQNLFSITGDLVIINFQLARILAERINKVKKNESKFDKQTTPGQLNAFGLLHEIFHYLIRYYAREVNPAVFKRLTDYIIYSMGNADLNSISLGFLKDFPPLDVYNGIISPEDYLKGSTGNKSNIEIILEEIILLHLGNINPSVTQLEELYSDKSLKEGTEYSKLLSQIDDFFLEEKRFGKDNLPLTVFLKSPIRNSPQSIEGQLEYILTNWNIYIPQELRDKLLRSKDLITEELKLFLQFGAGHLTPPVPVYSVDEEYLRKLREKLAKGEILTEDERRYYNSEIEKFTEDIDWMPKVVMIAKNIFVWLDQLSRKYNRPIGRLDQIPDEELDMLARWNFTALWLIGIWERSSASKKIKQLTGNPEAAPSAYSLFDYVIANELGGEEAFEKFKTRAWQRGIRLASDMVPNHTGIYSKWVVEKPGYFLQSNLPPYPGYTFYGANLSDDPRVEVRIEDKYYTREDAAVVFQRKDTYTGNVTYIYHGNDGTHMPWNDTAQLNLLNPETREALLNTILHVARKFPIIRFDAAMTLAKKHYQRLWFPQPGTGGAIPSRSDYSMSRQAFDQEMPNEFWREVVDKINSEMPETLLLAEAFWLMEGYFVRTLGMHRVYNSAFMHMLMKEENNKYHDLIKNTLEFNPEILKRYVNFMSNPDEETAINQFGKGDKYFGVAVMMITLPGLPMFAHGQIEGYSEKYGMEYKRAYYNEYPDEYMIRRHEAEIFPLLRKRYLFSQVRNFEFFEFTDDFGNKNENVFAYSNQFGDEHVLIIYNNGFARTGGSINYSSGKAEREGNKNIKVHKTAEALGFKNHHHYYYIYTEHRTGLEYLASGISINENGLHITLDGYEYKVFLNFKETYDETGEYLELNNALNGAGVPSINSSLIEMKLKPVHDSLINLFNREFFEKAKDYCLSAYKKEKGAPIKNNSSFIDPLTEMKTSIFIREAKRVVSIFPEDQKIILKLNSEYDALRYFAVKLYALEQKSTTNKSLEGIKSSLKMSSVSHDDDLKILFLYLSFKTFLNNKEFEYNYLFKALYLEKAINDILMTSGYNVENIYEAILIIKIFLIKEKLLISELFSDKYPPHEFISELISGKEACEYVMLNEYGGKIYFNKERMETLCNWLFTLGCILITSDNNTGAEDTVKRSKDKTSTEKKLIKLYSFFQDLKNASTEAGYQLNELKYILGKESGINIPSKRVKSKHKQIVKNKTIKKKGNS